MQGWVLNPPLIFRDAGNRLFAAASLFHPLSGSS